MVLQKGLQCSGRTQFLMVLQKGVHRLSAQAGGNLICMIDILPVVVGMAK
jgi:hypothetical protein